MTTYLLLSSIVIICCVIFSSVSNKTGVPMLLAFILLGMFFGCDGPFKINFSNFYFTEQICSIALIFIMFYGGFGTKWQEAKPVVTKSILLSSLGTVLTALFVGLFCYYALGITFLESMLIGSVISSTDAASVFSILRSKKLNLKYNTASLLEIESGSNDPFSYMLTITVLSLMNGSVTTKGFILLILAQIAFGLFFGFIIAKLTLIFLKHFKVSSSGFNAIFIVAVAIISYALPTVFNGNGYLSTYITGIILGNSKINNKPELVHFFDGITGLMQIVLFFLLGLLSFPSQLPYVAFTALCIALFLTFVARPLAVFAILLPFSRNLNQQMLISWAGMRGAASIVFAIMAVINPATINNDVFHIVFFIVLFSILIQGTLIPFMAKKLSMTDNSVDVMKTFNDYMDEIPVRFISLKVPNNHAWTKKKIKDLSLPPDSLIAVIYRANEEIIPNGSTQIMPNDTLILSGKSPTANQGINLYEKAIESGSDWIGKSVSSLSMGNDRIIMIRRNEKVIIPNGNTVILEKDILVIAEN